MPKGICKIACERPYAPSAMPTSVRLSPPASSGGGGDGAAREVRRMNRKDRKDEEEPEHSQAEHGGEACAGAQFGGAHAIRGQGEKCGAKMKRAIVASFAFPAAPFGFHPHSRRAHAQPEERL